ncbi:MAG: SCO1664 family protein [Dehalococcoidia bacterium]|nr:SCO1664 family protein [Dehalococcoidia bacterium]
MTAPREPRCPRGRASLPAPWDPLDPRVEDALREAAIGELHLTVNSSNYVYVAELAHAVLGPGLGVYKPERGEQPLHDFPEGLYAREIAAADFARLLGWEIVPPTVECIGPHGVGSLQLYIEHDPRVHYFGLREGDTYDEQLVRFAVFDLLANNADRKGGHLLLDPRGRIWGIDNGLCFSAAPKLRTVIWDYAGTAIPAAWLADIARVRAALVEGDAASAALRARLDAAERAALVERCEEMLATPVLPEMYPWRCTPWPLV